MTTLDLASAAAFLGMHPDTVAERARAGIIHGAKPGHKRAHAAPAGHTFGHK